jgi:acyl transferase domain-containing protein
VLASQSEWGQILTQVGALYRAGVTLDWDAFYQAGSTFGRRRKVLLPTYPFQRQRYWVDLTESSPPSSSAFSGAPAGAPASAPASTSIRQQLRSVTGANPQERLVAYLQRVVAPFLTAHGAAQEESATDRFIPLTVGFAELGMTSLDAVTLHNQLQLDFGHKLPATLVLDYPTVTALADYLTQTLLPQFETEPPTRQSSPSDVAQVRTAVIADVPLSVPVGHLADGMIDELSADEIAEKLAAKLGMSV